jgi:hypothetical protein
VTDVHREVELGDAALGQRDVVVDRGPVEPLEEQVLQPEPDLRVEGVARHRHEQRDAPPVGIAAREQPDLLGLVTCSSPITCSRSSSVGAANSSSLGKLSKIVTTAL